MLCNITKVLINAELHSKSTPSSHSFVINMKQKQNVVKRKTILQKYTRNISAPKNYAINESSSQKDTLSAFHNTIIKPK